MIIILWLLFTFVVAAIAGNRKLGFWPAFFISLLLSPLVGLIFTLASPSNETYIVTTTTHPAPLPPTISTELERLKKLKDDGAIDEGEYQNLKSQAIAKYSA